MKKISVILPTYNEKANIVRLMEAIHEQLLSYDHEIIIVDDNSPDGTFKVVTDSNRPYLKPILRTQDRGLANSIRCGLEKASGDILIVMDSDFNHQPIYLPFMIDSLNYYDCVLASRFVYGGKMDSRARHILSWCFNIFIRLITGGQITDSLYGFFAINRPHLMRCDFDKIFWGYGDYCIRLLYYLQQNNVSVLQFPAVNGKRFDGRGNRRLIKVFWQYFSEAIKFSWKIRWNIK